MKPPFARVCDDTPALRLRLFGPLLVERDGQPLPRLRSRKGYRLLNGRASPRG